MYRFFSSLLETKVGFELLREKRWTPDQMAESVLLPKTPISLLQEISARKGITPKYDLMSIEGAVHEPTFVYRVSVSDITATGTGQSKKKAKHSAAKSVLEKLLSGQTDVIPNVPDNESPEGKFPERIGPIVSPYDDGLAGNPVGQLQELCMSRRWPPPLYEVMDEGGQPHERLFTMGCLVKNFSEKGSGKSKKLAKRQAAFRMLEKLKDFTLVKPENCTNAEDDDGDEFLGGPRDFKVPSLNPSYSQKISQFYKNLKALPRKSLMKLHDMPLPSESEECIDFLQEIGTENSFEITYVDIEEISKTGKYQCLVQLSTMPVAVCHGTGLTLNDAQINAAENALNYLVYMTRDGGRGVQTNR